LPYREVVPVLILPELALVGAIGFPQCAFVGSLAPVSDQAGDGDRERPEE
jgi:hypothetical protein